MVSLSTLKTLLFTFGPILLPKALSYYRTLRATAASQAQPIRSVPRQAQYGLSILFFSCMVWLVISLPIFSPPNIFDVTSSRLHTPTDVLYARLHTLGRLTAFDEVLRPKLVSLESRLLYLKYGPNTLANCLFCAPDAPTSYLVFFLPSLLWPHILHLASLGLTTSSYITGREGGRLRTLFTSTGLLLAAGELYMVGTYDHKNNATALRGRDLDGFFWRMRTLRFIVFIAADMGLAYVLYLSSTNRLFISPPSLAEEMESTTRTLELGLRKLHAVGITKNAIARDETLRMKEETYWREEKRLMASVYEDREVIEIINQTIGNGRMDLARVTKEAEKYADLVTGGLERNVPGYD